MVNQKLISFKCDAVQLEKLDSITGVIGVNRNKFLNLALSFCLSAVLQQLDVASRFGKSPKNIPFLN